MNDEVVARGVLICGLMTSLLGALVLFGWAEDIRFLQSLVPGWSAMQPFTALAFVCSGAALLAGSGWPRLRAGLLTLVALPAAGAVWQYATGEVLGLDSLLFPRVVLDQPGYRYPGRMAEMTAVKFLLATLCFILPRRHAWQQRTVSALGSLGLVLAMVSLAGYAFGATGLPGMVGYSAMAAHTALGFLVLFLGLKLSLPPDGWLRLLLSPKSGGKVARHLLPLVVVWPIIAGMAVNWLDGADIATSRLNIAMLLVAVIVGQIWVIVRFAERLNRAEDGQFTAEENLRLKNERLHRMSEAAQKLLTSEEPRSIVQSLCERAMALADCQVFVNYLVDNGKPHMSLNAYAGISAETAQEMSCPAAASALLDGSACGGCQIVLEGFHNAPGRRSGLMRELGLQASVCYPLVHQGRSIGTLAFGTTNRTRFSDEDLGLMKAVSELVATAMLRKQTEEALSNSNVQLARALRLGKMGNWQLDARTMELTWSDEVFHLFGVQPGESLDYESFLARVHQDDRAYVDESWRAAQRGEPYDIEHRIVVGNEVKWVREQAELEFDADGQVVSGHGTAQDITDKVQARQALEAARREAERANDAKTRFLAAASHDLRQPVQALRLLLEVLANRLDQPEAAGMLVGRMGEALGSTETMLARLMEFAALESGRVAVQREVFAVDELVHRVAGEHAAEAAAKGLVLRVRTFACFGHSDPVQLERMVRNLLVNAIRYTVKGGILLALRRRGGQLMIEVRDTGIGISADKRELIFEEFRQIDNAARERAKGMGLGLAIVARTARLLGHPLTLASTEGRGSLFAITLPQAERPDDPAGSEGSMDDLGPACRARILVVEDDPAQAAGLEMILVDCGHEVRVAHEAASALEILQSGASLPDVLLTDYRLPGGVSGVEFVRRSRIVAGRAIPAILVTGDTHADIAVAARAAGCLVLHKPYIPDVLLGMLDAALAGAAGMECGAQRGAGKSVPDCQAVPA